MSTDYPFQIDRYNEDIILDRKRFIKIKNIFLQHYPNEAANIKETKTMYDNKNDNMYILSFVDENCIMYYNFKTKKSFKFQIQN